MIRYIYKNLLDYQYENIKNNLQLDHINLIYYDFIVYIIINNNNVKYKYKNKYIDLYTSVYRNFILNSMIDYSVGFITPTSKITIKNNITNETYNDIYGNDIEKFNYILM